MLCSIVLVPFEFVMLYNVEPSGNMLLWMCTIFFLCYTTSRDCMFFVLLYFCWYWNETCWSVLQCISWAALFLEHFVSVYPFSVLSTSLQAIFVYMEIFLVSINLGRITMLHDIKNLHFPKTFALHFCSFISHRNICSRPSVIQKYAEPFTFLDLKNVFLYRYSFMKVHLCWYGNNVKLETFWSQHKNIFHIFPIFRQSFRLNRWMHRYCWAPSTESMIIFNSYRKWKRNKCKTMNMEQKKCQVHMVSYHFVLSSSSPKLLISGIYQSAVMSMSWFQWHSITQ